MTDPPIRGAGPSGRTRDRVRAGPWVATAAVAGAVMAAYLFAYPFHDIHPVGFDIQAYVWQTKAVGHGPLAAVGARPGLPSMAALLGSVLRVDTPREVVVLMPVLALVLGLTVAGALRLGLGLPAWSVPVIVVVMALYPGTARVVHGYQASLLVMVLATAGVALVVQARGRPATLVTAGAVLTAACLTHVVLFVLFACIAALFAVLSIPDLLRDRRAGVSPLATDAGAAGVTVLPAMLLGAGAIYGWLGVRLGSTINTTNVASTLHQRTLSEVRRIRPFVSGPLAVIGAVFGRIRGRSRTARATARFGLSWLAVTMVGTLLGLVGQRVAGHRFLLFAVPVPALAGLGIVAVGWLLARRDGSGWTALGAAVAAGLIVAVAAGGVSYFASQTNPRRGAIYPQLRSASAYLDRYAGDRPVVFLIDDRRGALAAYSPKYRSYVIRAGVPDDVVARTFVFPGKLEDLQAGRPTILPETEPWQRTFNEVSRTAWEQVGPALRQGAVALIAQAFAVDQFEAAMQQDPERRVSPGLYVIRGPAPQMGAAPAEGAFGVIPGAFTAAGLFFTLVVLGWGVVAAAVRPAEATLLDVTLVAPAAGAAMAVVGGFLLAVLGADPGGMAGVVALVTLAAASVTLGWRSRGSSGPNPPEPSAVVA